MVDKFRTILEKIKSEKGNVNIFAILKMDEFTDKWTVLLSAPWITEETLKENFLYLRELLVSTFSFEEMTMIAKIVVSTNDEHIIQELLNFKPESIISSDQQINGNLVHEAYILASESNP